MEIMPIRKHNQLDQYAFYWSQARLLIAAVALFIGGVPPVLAFNPISSLSSMISSLLNLAWIISGVVSAYLLYRWITSGKKLFGVKNSLDTTAFMVNIITGFNLGWTGISGNNFGMSISSSQIIFVVTGLIYLAVFVHLFKRWNQAGEKLF